MSADSITTPRCHDFLKPCRRSDDVGLEPVVLDMTSLRMLAGRLPRSLDLVERRVASHRIPAVLRIGKAVSSVSRRPRPRRGRAEFTPSEAEGRYGRDDELRHMR